MQPYEILLRWKDDGTFSGGHTIRCDPVTGGLSDALPLGKDGGFPWVDASKEINEALAATVDIHLEAREAAEETLRETNAALTAAQAELETLKSEWFATLEAVKATLPNDFHPAAVLIKKVETAKAEEARVLELSATERRREELQKELAELDKHD